MPFPIPEEHVDLIDKDKWGKDFEIENADFLTTKTITGHILYRMLFYKKRAYEDGQLWEYFKEDFEGWTTEIFSLANTDLRRDLRNYLRDHGVFVVKDGKKIAERLADVVKNEEYHEWTDEEIKLQISTSNTFNSRFNPDRHRHQISQVTSTAQTPLQGPKQQQSAHIQQPALIQQFPPAQQFYQPQGHLPQYPQGFGYAQVHQNTLNNMQMPQSATRIPSSTPYPHYQGRSNAHQPNPQFTPISSNGNTPAPSAPPAPNAPQTSHSVSSPVTGQPSPSPLVGLRQPLPQSLAPTPQDLASTKKITDLAKLYNDNMRYDGEMYNILNMKLAIFYDCCRKVGLTSDQYHNAYSVMLKGRASVFYYDKLSVGDLNFDQMIYWTRVHFETEENRQEYMKEWRALTFFEVVKRNPDKSRLDCLQILFDKLQILQRGLTEFYQTDYSLRDQVISACQGVKECEMCLFKPADTFEGVCSELRSSIGTAMRSREIQQFNNYDVNSKNYENNYNLDYDVNYGNQYDQNWTDRTYRGEGRGHGRSTLGHRGASSRGSSRANSSSRGGSYRGGYQGNRGYQENSFQKKCYICNKPGCWSTKHSTEERRQSQNRYRQFVSSNGQQPTQAAFHTFLANYEGTEGWSENEDIGGAEQMMLEMSIENEGFEGFEQFFTEFGEVDGPQTVAILSDQSTLHAITRIDAFSEPKVDIRSTSETSVFTFEDRYASTEFHGIMPDSGASGVSTAGEAQVAALQRLDPSIQVNTEKAGESRIRFGKGETTTRGTIQVPTPLGVITFHVVSANTPFLMCIQDMDRMKVKLDNLENVLIQGNKRVPVKRKWGHPWMLLNHPEEALAWSHLTDMELRQLHRRFGHPSARRLLRVLQESRS